MSLISATKTWGSGGFLINVLAQRTDAIGVAKRVARFPSTKYVIYISTPIPDNEQVSYGISNVKEAFFKEITKKYSYILESLVLIVTIIYIIIYLETSKKTALDSYSWYLI
ncbi:hypothetical protein KCP76_15170 [Salmonella enterica subsp. enterica serovar Weltevreden]|nr:hypothetical protein KCP76_15170 [Salmonella enterica subsp. enterica serovar Weltevreden]